MELDETTELLIARLDMGEEPAGAWSSASVVGFSYELLPFFALGAILLAVCAVWMTLQVLNHRRFYLAMDEQWLHLRRMNELTSIPLTSIQRFEVKRNAVQALVDGRHVVLIKDAYSPQKLSVVRDALSRGRRAPAKSREQTLEQVQREAVEFKRRVGRVRFSEFLLATGWITLAAAGMSGIAVWRFGLRWEAAVILLITALPQLIAAGARKFLAEEQERLSPRADDH